MPAKIVTLPLLLALLTLACPALAQPDGCDRARVDGVISG